MAAAKLEELTERGVSRYRDLAGNSGNIDFLLQLMFNNSHLAVSVARKIQGSDRAGIAKYDIEMLERTAHPQGYALIPKHLEMREADGLVAITTHGIGPYSVESSPVQVNSEQLPVGSLPDEFLLVYALPQAGLSQRIASLVFSPGNQQKNSRILRFIDEKELAGPVPPSDYTSRIPKGYEGAYITLQRIMEIFGLSAQKRTGFGKSHADIFLPYGRAKGASVIDFVNAAQKDGFLNDGNIDEMLQKILGAAVMPGIHSDRTASVKTPLSDAAPYNFPGEDGDAYITAKQIYTAKGWKPWKLTPFIKENSKFFESVKGYKGKVITLRNLAGIAGGLLNNEQWQSILEQAKSGSIVSIASSSKQSTRRSHSTDRPGPHIYTERPDVQPYEPVLKHPEALLPSVEDAAHILGIERHALATGTYYRHPWIKKDGTIKALERYIHFRAENAHHRKPNVLKSELEACLERLREYEASHPPARRGHSDNPPPAPPTRAHGARSYYPSVVEPLADVMLTEQQIREGYFGERQVISRFINEHYDLFTNSYGIARAPFGKLAESLDSSAMLTEKFFGILLQAARQRKSELGQIKGLVDGVKLSNGDYDLDFAELKERLPTISGIYADLAKHHPTLFKNRAITLENLVTAVRLRAEDHPADFKTKVAGLGMHLGEIAAFDNYLSSPTSDLKEEITQGTAREGDGVAQLPSYIVPGSPIAQLYTFLQAKYTAKQIGPFFGYEGRELDAKLREWEKRRLLVPGEDKKYSGEDVVGRLVQLAKEEPFRSWGYKGEKGDIFRAVNTDLLGIQVYKKEKGGGEPKSGDNRGAALDAYVRQHLPGDELALRIAAELSRGEIDWNRAGKDLPRELMVKPDAVLKTFDLLTQKGIALQGNTGYTLNASILTSH